MPAFLTDGPGFYESQFGMTCLQCAHNRFNTSNSQIFGSFIWINVIEWQWSSPPLFLLLRFAISCYAPCILIGVLIVKYSCLKEQETLSKWNIGKSFSLFYSQTTRILWFLCLFPTLVRMPRELNIISWVW